MLDARRLRVLCAVADHPTLSAAADALSYTPSAVSQQIVALEREIGVRVLHRGPRGVRLTAAGQLLVEQARPILSGLQAAEASVIALDGLSRGRLALASFATAGRRSSRVRSPASAPAIRRSRSRSPRPTRRRPWHAYGPVRWT